MNTARADDAYMKLVERFPLVPLRNKAHFEEAIKLMKELTYRRTSLSKWQTDYLSVLGGLIADYEKQLPRLASKMTPQEALLYLMQVNGLAQADLVEFVGYKSNLSAFLSGHRALSKRAAVRLAEYFKVSPALFLPKE